MRYTTIIDISASRPLYRNHNVRLVYLHMCLRCGYHDNDRDMLRMSIRAIAADTGLSVSATRHALALLLRAKLIERIGDVWRVFKWIPEQQISARPATKKQQQQQTARAIEQQQQREREARENEQKRQREVFEQSGKTTYMVYYESQLEAARNGDLDAQKIVERNRELYEAHKKRMEQNQWKSAKN